MLQDIEFLASKADLTGNKIWKFCPFIVKILGLINTKF